MPKITKKIVKPVSRNSTVKTSVPVTGDRMSYVKQTGQSSQLLITLLVGVLAFSTGYLTSQVRNLSSGKAAGATTATTQQPAPNQPAEVKVTQDQVKELVNNSKITLGNKNSKVNFVEFSDPSCPYCHIAGGDNPELAKEANFTYKSEGGTYVPPVTEMRRLVDEGKASYTMLYTNGHGNGILGTQAMYCAMEKNAFWEVHDLLMSNAGYTLLNDTVKNDKANSQQLADFLGAAVDPVFMNECLSSEKYKDQITKDETAARSLGVSGTPHFLVNTTAFRGAYSYTDMEAAVNSALED